MFRRCICLLVSLKLLGSIVALFGVCPTAKAVPNPIPDLGAKISIRIHRAVSDTFNYHTLPLRNTRPCIFHRGWGYRHLEFSNLNFLVGC